MHETIRVHGTRSEQHLGERTTSISPDGKYLRTLIYTGFIAPNQNPTDIVRRFATPLDDFPGEDKLVCMGAKLISISQGRYRRINEIHSGLFSQIATHFGTRTEHGTGVAGNPAKIQAAIDEVGLARIALASGASAIEKAAYRIGILNKRQGLFFKIAGKDVEVIDGLVVDGGYQNHVILAPINPDETCTRIENDTGIPTAIVDISYIGGSILGLSPFSPYSREELFGILSDNPFGQGKGRTPIAVVGKLK